MNALVGASKTQASFSMERVHHDYWGPMQIEIYDSIHLDVGCYVSCVGNGEKRIDELWTRYK